MSFRALSKSVLVSLDFSVCKTICSAPIAGMKVAKMTVGQVYQTITTKKTC